MGMGVGRMLVGPSPGPAASWVWECWAAGRPPRVSQPRHPPKLPAAVDRVERGPRERQLVGQVLSCARRVAPRPPPRRGPMPLPGTCGCLAACRISEGLPWLLLQLAPFLKEQAGAYRVDSGTFWSFPANEACAPEKGGSPSFWVAWSTAQARNWPWTCACLVPMLCLTGLGHSQAPLGTASSKGSWRRHRPGRRDQGRLSRCQGAQPGLLHQPQKVDLARLVPKPVGVGQGW